MKDSGSNCPFLMPKTCQEIIKEILLEATANGQTITEKELIKILDRTPGFWEQAILEDFSVDVTKIQPKPENN